MSQDAWQEQIERSFGHGPALPPVEVRVEAGRRALLRRRMATVAATLGIVAAVGTTYAVAAPGAPQGRATTGEWAQINQTQTTQTQPNQAQDPETERVPLPWEDDEPVRYVDGELEIRDGVIVHERIDNPYGYEPPKHSAALDLTFKDKRSWVIVTVSPKGYGFSSSVPSNGWASFSAYVADQTDGQVGGEDGWPETMRLAPDGRVVPAPGVTVYDRTDDPQLGDSFAEPGTTVGAAVVGVEGRSKSYFVVWRVIGGELDVITTPPNDVVGATFEQLLTYARSQYASGEGLR